MQKPKLAQKVLEQKLTQKVLEQTSPKMLMTSPISVLSDSYSQLHMVLHHDSTIDTVLTNCLPTHLSSLYHSHITNILSPATLNSVLLSPRYTATQAPAIQPPAPPFVTTTTQ